ncbi:hypothetical protein COV93_05815 [Candidatus Woesearchaeota archaeon CG11_big_fil_rev_8_21_14_0_20_43_8]|nr:MAG: hypothetical protein COV93_05815 [Candidatus Woesearchaeota archaeon CG11_big_fil_rev_8_21_14_0_20_43_8]
MIIRKATESDVAAIGKLNLFGEILRRCSPLDQLDPAFEDEVGYYRDFIDSEDKWCYVAEHGGELAGFVLFNVERRESFWEIKKVGYIDLIYVDERHRKKGISKLLLEKAYEQFRKNGLRYVKLSVQTKNPDANAVWQKHGYKEFLKHMYKMI